MAKNILDASVILKWFTKEEDSDKAIAYLKAFQNNDIIIIVPSLLFYELGNAFIRKKEPKYFIADIGLKLQNLQLEVRDVGLPLFQKIYQNALDYSLTFYDASYLTLMQEENCEFITADKKLYEKVKKKFALVKLL